MDQFLERVPPNHVAPIVPRLGRCASERPHPDAFVIDTTPPALRRDIDLLRMGAKKSTKEV